MKKENGKGKDSEKKIVKMVDVKKDAEKEKVLDNAVKTVVGKDTDKAKEKKAMTAEEEVVMLRVQVDELQQLNIIVNDFRNGGNSTIKAQSGYISFLEKKLGINQDIPAGE